LSNALRDQQGLSEIRQKIYTDCKDIWARHYIQHFWPEWLKNPANIKRAYAGQVAMRAKQEQKAARSTSLENALIDQQSPNTAVLSEEHKLYIKNQEESYDSLRLLIANLSGLETHEERNKISNNNRELVEKTKEYRFKILKQMNDYDVRETYGLSQTLYHLLNDFLQQLLIGSSLLSMKSYLVLFLI